MGDNYYFNGGTHQYPNGCSDIEHWKECARLRYWTGHGHCKHPSDMVDKDNGFPICSYSDKAITREKYKGDN